MGEKKLRRGKPKRLFHVIFRTVTVSIVLIVLAAVAAVVYFTGRFVITEKSAARIDVLEQISDMSSANRRSMENVMNMVYNDLYADLVRERDNRRIQAKLDAMQALFDSVGLDVTIDVVINARTVYMTDNETDESIRTLLNSYWYIKHYSGETSESWNLRFVDAQDINSYYLSYGRTVYNTAGKVAAVIVINTSQEFQFRTLQRLVGTSDKVYILDSNGIVICHSNPQMVGDWLANMTAFEDRYGYDASSLIRRSDQTYLISNFHDDESGWTFVEEQNITEILESAVRVMAVCVLIILFIGAMVSAAAHHRVQHALRSLSTFTEDVSRMEPENLRPLPVRTDYYELQVLGTVFNQMIGKLQDLIRDIQLREKERQKTEYDFLQAQLNPHFMHNTLLAVRSLLAMGRTEQAGRMVGEFAELLYTPTTADIPFVALREELHLLDSFVSIMNCRTEKQVEFTHMLPERLLDVSVPRMILQPIVSNAFFHGFAERDSGCRIRVEAAVQGRILLLSVWDNGEGITPRRMQEISTPQYAGEGHHHGIGLQNIRRRLKIIYGGSSDVTVESRAGVFTRVTVRIDGFDHPPMNEAAQRIIRSGASEEERHENSGG